MSNGLGLEQGGRGSGPFRVIRFGRTGQIFNFVSCSCAEASVVVVVDYPVWG